MKKKCLVSVPVLLIAAVSILVITACSGSDPSSPQPSTMAVLNPTVTGPIAAPDRPAPGSVTSSATRNYNFLASQFDLASRGYVEEEYFISGTASRFNTFPTVGETGAVLDSGNPYKTRIVVRRPISAAKFSGTAVFEWYNVTNNMDMEYCWYLMYDYIMRKGHVWVGVSAQRVGVNALKAWSAGTAADRYGTLDVLRLKDGTALTADAFQYDIFSQAVQAIRHPVGINPLGSLTPTTIIAIGQSQSASQLANYVNYVQPLAQVIDAFVLESSLGNVIRNDLIVPVWKVLAETDVISMNEANRRRPDDSKFVTWEVAGTSHNDARAYVSRVFLQHRDMKGVAVEDSLACAFFPGSEIPFYYALTAGLDQLIVWARGGAPIVSAPPIDVVQFTPTIVVNRDIYGNATGGIRLPQQQVPTGENSGVNWGNGACARWGYSDPFGAYTLNNIYTTHASYVSLVTTAANSALKSKYILPEDAAQAIADATSAIIPPNGH